MKLWIAIAGISLMLRAVAQTSQRATGPTAFPEIINLPNGFPPEGIASGRGSTLYAGNRDTGAIYQVNLRTGRGQIFVPSQSGRMTMGLKYDSRSHFVYAAGRTTGNAYVYDADNGTMVAEISLTPASETFINDVVVTQSAAYFTDYSRPYVYRVPLGADGALGCPPCVQEIPLGGDFKFVPGRYNANGIDVTKDGKYLILVNSYVGELYRVNPGTAEVRRIDLGADCVKDGDGILIYRKMLYVVLNRQNQVVRIELDKEFTTGKIVDRLRNSSLVP